MSALKQVWPHTKVQRCLFHVYSQVRRYTTSRPKLLAGQELYKLALDLMSLKNIQQAQWWVENYLNWCEFWADFLEEQSIINGKKCYTHERLRKARSSLSRLINKGVLFNYLDSHLTKEGPLPSTNNLIEGKVNAQLRALLNNHRGLSLMRRVKAIFWWCYMHTQSPKPPKELLQVMPTDDDIDLLYQSYSPYAQQLEDGPKEWGDKVVWEELHHKNSYPYWIE